MRQTQAEDLLGFMVGDLRERLVPLGRLDVLDDVGDKALAYFASLDVEALETTALINQAKVLEQIGQVRLAQGSTDEALEAFKHSLRVSESLTARDTNNPEAVFALGTAHYWVGFANWKLGVLEETERHWTNYFRAAQSLVALEPGSETWQVELSYAYNNLGTIARDRENHERALEMFAKSIAAKEQVLRINPANHTVRMELADSLSWLGSSYLSQGRLDDAHETYARMREALRTVVASDQDNAGFRYRWGLAHQHSAHLSMLQGDLLVAQDHLTAAIEVNDALKVTDPTNMTWQRDRAYLLTKQGQILAAEGHEMDAYRLYRSAQKILRQLVALDPANREWTLLFASNELLIVDTVEDSSDAVGDREVASSAALSIQKELSIESLTPHERSWLIRAHLLSRDASVALGDPESAGHHLQSAQWVVQHAPQPLSNPVDLASAYEVAVASDRQDLARGLADSLIDLGYREARFVDLCRSASNCPALGEAKEQFVKNGANNDKTNN